MGTTQQAEINRLNKKYQLDGEGREESREKHMLAVRTVPRAVKEGIESPKKKGKKSEISREFLRLVAVHTIWNRLVIRLRIYGGSGVHTLMSCYSSMD